MRLYVLVAAGGAIGSVARFWLAGVVGRLAGTGFPWGTILINIVGSAAIGALASVTTRGVHAPAWQAFAMVGLCGGFTTFSAFSLQTLDLLREGRAGAAAANVGASVALCLAGAALGRQAALY